MSYAVLSKTAKKLGRGINSNSASPEETYTALQPCHPALSKDVLTSSSCVHFDFVSRCVVANLFGRFRFLEQYLKKTVCPFNVQFIYPVILFARIGLHVLAFSITFLKKRAKSLS